MRRQDEQQTGDQDMPNAILEANKTPGRRGPVRDATLGVVVLTALAAGCFDNTHNCDLNMSLARFYEGTGGTGGALLAGSEPPRAADEQRCSCRAGDLRDHAGPASPVQGF